MTNDRVCQMQIDETNRWIPWAFVDQAEDRMGRFSASAHCVSHRRFTAIYSIARM